MADIQHSRAGKSTGKYSSWRNTERQDGHMSAINWNKDVDNGYQYWVRIKYRNPVKYT